MYQVMPNQSPMLFGFALRKLREEAGLTQEQLAQKSGVHRVTISKLEANETREPGWTVLIGLAKGLGITVDSFVDAARHYTPPPLDRLQSLEDLVKELEGRLVGLEDRALETQETLKKTRAIQSQHATRLSQIEGARRQK